MKTLLLTMLVVFAVPGEERRSVPGFQALGPALVLLDGLIATGDASTLGALMRSGARVDERALRMIVSSGSLAERYREREFPATGDSLKLGGHAKELGHAHVDFVKVEGTWHIDRIWSCR